MTEQLKPQIELNPQENPVDNAFARLDRAAPGIHAEIEEKAEYSKLVSDVLEDIKAQVAGPRQSYESFEEYKERQQKAISEATKR
jgi:hypothetical protein